MLWLLCLVLILSGCEIEEKINETEEIELTEKDKIGEEVIETKEQENRYDEDKIREFVIRDINDIRLKNNLSSLIYDKNIEDKAEKWALYLKNTNSFETNEFVEDFEQVIHKIPYHYDVEDCGKVMTDEENVKCLIKDFEGPDYKEPILNYNTFGVGIEIVTDDGNDYNAVYVFYFYNNISEIVKKQNLKFSEIRDSVFNKIRIEREKRNLSLIKRNYDLDRIADIKAENLIGEGFHHTDRDGKKIGNILKENDFFYITAGENLFQTSLKGDENNEYLGNLSVLNWLESLRHRSLILNRDDWLYTDMGIGLSLDEENGVLNFALVFATLEETGVIEAEDEYCYPIKLYDEDLFERGIFEEINVNFVINSSQRISRVFLVEDILELDDCWKSSKLDEIRVWRNVHSLNEILSVRQGYTILLKMTRDSNIKYKINYKN